MQVADWEEGVVGVGSPVSHRPRRLEAEGPHPVEHCISRQADCSSLCKCQGRGHDRSFERKWKR